MMEKFGTYGEYPQQSLHGAEAALLTIWRSLTQYHEDLALVGGLAMHYLTKPNLLGLPGVVTMDVDLGIDLAACGGQYGTIKTFLGGLGFASQGSRLVRKHEGMNLYIDFLTENPPLTQGTAMVDDGIANVFPGVNRALTNHRRVSIRGRDLFGAEHECNIKVAEIGPMLVMKLNSFGGPNGRRSGKDAYDILLGVIGYLQGPQVAVEAFKAERIAGNTAFQIALEVLRRDFSDEGRDGPLRASFFYPENKEQIRQDTVTVAQMLLSE